MQHRLRKHGLLHLRARKHGSTVILESQPDDSPFKHFRLRRDTVHLWWLGMAGRGQCWEKTPLRAQRDELVDMVVDTFHGCSPTLPETRNELRIGSTSSTGATRTRIEATTHEPASRPQHGDTEQA